MITIYFFEDVTVKTGNSVYIIHKLSRLVILKKKKIKMSATKERIK